MKGHREVQSRGGEGGDPAWVTGHGGQVGPPGVGPGGELLAGARDGGSPQPGAARGRRARPRRPARRRRARAHGSPPSRHSGPFLITGYYPLLSQPEPSPTWCSRCPTDDDGTALALGARTRARPRHPRTPRRADDLLTRGLWAVGGVARMSTPAAHGWGDRGAAAGG